MLRHLLIVTFVLVLFLPSVATAEEFSFEQYLNIKSSVDGSWSPDGTNIVYRSNASGTFQVWKIPAQGGEPKQLTDYPDAVSFVEYSPTEPLILFGKDEGGNERTQFYLMDADGKNVRRLTGDDGVIHNFGAWSHNGKRIAYAKNKRDARFFDVFVMDVETGKEHQVLQHDGNNEAAGWSWNDDYLIVSTWDSNDNNNLTMIQIPSLKDTLLTPHEGWATYTHVAWPPKRDYFYLLSSLGLEWKKLAKYYVPDEALEVQEYAMWDAESLAMSRDGTKLAYSMNMNGYSKPVFILASEAKMLGEVKLPGGVINRFEFSPDGRKILFNYTAPDAVPDLWTYDIASQKSDPLTHSDLAGITKESFVTPQFVSFPGHRGVKIYGYLYLPPSIKKDGSNPVVVFAHGGPEGQERPAFARTYQYLVRQGFSVFVPNVRGSDGYGKTFLHLDDKYKRLDSLRDYAAGVAYLKTTGYFDMKKVGIMGGSYGGYVVLGSLTEYPELYACGVSVVGISNFVTFLEKTGPWRRTIREAEYGSLDRDKEFLQSISPVHKADAIRAPVMIIQGANDPRVPKEEADQMVEAMRKNNLTVDYLLYEDEGHGLSKLKNRLDAYPKIARFLKAHLGVAEEKPAPTPEKKP